MVGVVRISLLPIISMRLFAVSCQVVSATYSRDVLTYDVRNL